MQDFKYIEADGYCQFLGTFTRSTPYQLERLTRPYISQSMYMDACKKNIMRARACNNACMKENAEQAEPCILLRAAPFSFTFNIIYIYIYIYIEREREREREREIM